MENAIAKGAVADTRVIGGGITHNRAVGERGSIGGAGVIGSGIAPECAVEKDESLEESANLPAPEVIAAEIAEDLEAALEQFATIAEDLGKR